MIWASSPWFGHLFSRWQGAYENLSPWCWGWLPTCCAGGALAITWMSHCRGGGREWGCWGRQSRIQVHGNSGCPSSPGPGTTCFPACTEKVITSTEVFGVFWYQIHTHNHVILGIIVEGTVHAKAVTLQSNIKEENKTKLVFDTPEIPLADLLSYDNEELQRPLLSMASGCAVPQDGLLLLSMWWVSHMGLWWLSWVPLNFLKSKLKFQWSQCGLVGRLRLTFFPLFPMRTS